MRGKGRKYKRKEGERKEKGRRQEISVFPRRPLFLWAGGYFTKR